MHKVYMFHDQLDNSQSIKCAIFDDEDLLLESQEYELPLEDPIQAEFEALDSIIDREIILGNSDIQILFRDEKLYKNLMLSETTDLEALKERKDELLNKIETLGVNVNYQKVSGNYDAIFDWASHISKIK